MDPLYYVSNGTYRVKVMHKQRCTWPVQVYPISRKKNLTLERQEGKFKEMLGYVMNYSNGTVMEVKAYDGRGQSGVLLNPSSNLL